MINLEVIFKTLFIWIDCFHRNKWYMIIRGLSCIISYISCVLLHSYILHGIFHVQFLFLSLRTYQYHLVVLILLLSFLGSLAMLILVLLKSELDQGHIFHYTSCKDFQVHLQVMCCFEHTSYDNNQDFSFHSFSTLF